MLDIVTIEPRDTLRDKLREHPRLGIGNEAVDVRNRFGCDGFLALTGRRPGNI
jgi:hypothetical protein